MSEVASARVRRSDDRSRLAATGRRASVLRGHGLSFTHPGAAHPAVTGVSVEVRPGRLLAVLGPNGAGKSTLLKLLSGVLASAGGRVTLNDRPLSGLDDRARATTVAVVPQSEASPFPATVREVVEMGRYPHQRAWERSTPSDRRIVDGVLERCRVSNLQDRDLDTLSGGERQRVRIARALAQEAPILLLDEPTAGLDLRYRMEVFHLLRALSGDGLAVLLITHDLNLAARFAHEVLLLDRGRMVVAGAPADVLREQHLEPVYAWPLRIVPHAGPGADSGAPQAVPLRREPT